MLTDEGDTLTLSRGAALHGLGGDDVLTGSSSADQLYGDADNDSLAGDNGDDVLAGGLAVVESQVALMVQSMAAFGAPAGVNGQWTEEQREALNPILAGYWQPKA